MGAVEIATALAASRRAVRLYPPEHPTHREGLADLTAAVTAAIDVRPLVLNLREGRLYEGSEVIAEHSPPVRALAEAMESRRVESLTFHLGFTETDGEGLSQVLSLRPSPELQVQEELDARGVRAVTVSELEDNTSRDAEERDRQREADRTLYRAALNALKNVTNALAEGAEVQAVEATRAIALLIERVAEDPDAIEALALMTGHGELWRFHAVSVMLRSLVLGHELGLSDKQLLALGLAGLMHDVGRVLLGDEDVDSARISHPMRGAHALGPVSDEDCLAMLVAYEHHMGVDGSGWPEREPDHSTHPYSRIVAIADRFDNLIRPAEGRGMRLDEAAVQVLREASGGPLDPTFAVPFVASMGVIPIGSAVRLSDQSVGIVSSPGEQPLRPRIRLVLASDGVPLRPTVELDLADDERAIVGLIAPDLLDLDPSDYL